MKNELAITDAQKKMWDNYAACVKESAASMPDVYPHMMSVSIPATLPERIKLHESIMGARFETMKSTNATTLALYNVLDDVQKKKADDLIVGIGMM